MTARSPLEGHVGRHVAGRVAGSRVRGGSASSSSKSIADHVAEAGFQNRFHALPVDRIAAGRPGFGEIELLPAEEVGAHWGMSARHRPFSSLVFHPAWSRWRWLPQHEVDVLGPGAGRGDVVEEPVVGSPIPGGHVGMGLVVAHTGVEKDRVVRRPDEPGVDRHDGAAGRRVDGCRLKPFQVGARAPPAWRPESPRGAVGRARRIPRSGRDGCHPA